MDLSTANFVKMIREHRFDFSSQIPIRTHSISLGENRCCMALMATL
jgi:hypothetical protein